MNYPFVDRLHVSASDADVRAATLKALRPEIAVSKDPAVVARRKRLMQMAVRQHHANQKMYGFVMGGMRRNPELLVVENPRGGRTMKRRRKNARRRRYKVGRKMYTFQALKKRFGAAKAKAIRSRKARGGKRGKRKGFPRKNRRNKRRYRRNRR